MSDGQIVMFGFLGAMFFGTFVIGVVDYLVKRAKARRRHIRMIERECECLKQVIKEG